MKKIDITKAFKIEYILLAMAIFIFSTTVYLKRQPGKASSQLASSISSLQINYPVLVAENKIHDIKKLTDSINDQCAPYSFFNDKIEADLIKLNTLLAARNGEQDIYPKLIEATVKLSSDVQKNLRLFDHCYDSIFYVSVFLSSIALFVIFKNLTKKKNDLYRFQSFTQAQKNISRDLHDGIAQDLAALKVYLQKEDYEKTNYYAEHAINEVRYMIDSMHFDISDNILEIFRQTLSSFENNHGIKTEFFAASDNIFKVSTGFHIEFFRILQEALSNIARHSEATEVSVKLTDIACDTKFIIQDNGKGFSPEQIEKLQETDNKKHYGIKNIKERVASLGGTVEFINNGGTTIAVTVKNIVR